MKYVFFSDIHASEEGLRKLRDNVNFQAADKKICLGDTFNAHQYETMKNIFYDVQKISDIVLMGNHEAVLVDECDESVFNKKVQGDIIRNKSLIRNESDSFLDDLRSLPSEFTTDMLMATHANFDATDKWKHIRYIEDLSGLEPHLRSFVNIIGHGHIPFIAWKEDNLWYYQRQIYGVEFTLEPEKTYVVNAGSVLGSREMRHSERTFVVYDETVSIVKFYNLEIE